MDYTLIVAVLILMVMVLILATEGRDMSSLCQMLCAGIVGVTVYLFQSCNDESYYQNKYEGGAAAKKKTAKKDPKKAAAKKSDKKPVKKTTKKAAAKKDTKPGKAELVSAGLVPVSKDGKKVLVTQTKSGMWTFVRGHMEGSKKPEDIAMAANNENLGLSVKSADLKEKMTREYSFDVSEESYKRHIERMKRQKKKPQISGPGTQHRQQVYYVTVVDEKEPKVNKDALRDAKWMTWADAEKHLSGAKGEPPSKQLETLKEAADWAKKNIK